MPVRGSAPYAARNVLSGGTGPPWPQSSFRGRRRSQEIHSSPLSVFAGIRRHEDVRSGERAAESPPSTSTPHRPDERTNLRTVAAFQVRPGGQADVITSTSDRSQSQATSVPLILLPFL
ncbi:hypothetical protein THAOC_14128 [Thalassiosira oceanica]|uniref:Uncharacterized protein n=1 Tax=Thalassiosira oceanica TaxID=159749 RepID=K0SJE3_THAOC|nr:hypothetical protein THAOC_14128 [Thalassiosira oceanica]|eukprot:EJK65069.1 hypothetical protein THAOC_14128 [Thalassiosira oceanica]